jgi:hypothetical protein
LNQNGNNPIMAHFEPQTRFTMCSLYPRDRRAICAGFLGKDEKTVADLAALHSEALLWSGAGSGVISLADLEAELTGRRVWDPSGNSDREFLAACHQAGILVFAVVFTAQGYEIQIELNPDETEIISFGRTAGKGKPGVWGLREFYQDRYPRIYPGFGKYLSPERLDLLKISGAEKDFLAATACRDINDDLSICYWVTSSGLPRDFNYTNYFMCKNSPLWREHLKTIIEMQIDAGFDGIQFDEPALAMEPGGTRAGFCPHCQERFRAYMVEHYGDKFRDLDYPGLLKKKGAGIISELAYFKGLPHWRDWKRSSLVDARRNMAELIDHTRAYARTKGKEIPVAANFAFWLPHHLALADLVDVFSLEYHPGLPPNRSGIIYYEIGRALDENKPVTLVPHIGFAAHLRERAKKKNAEGLPGDVNILRYLIAEAAFAGGDFMVPYSCLGLTGEGAYYPPVELISSYLQFARDEREKWRHATVAGQAAVVLSFPSYFWSFDFLNLPGKHFTSFNAVTNLLRASQIQYRILVWGDDDFVPDRHDVSADELLILPEASHLTDRQISDIEQFSEKGGRVLMIGNCGLRDGLDRKRNKPPFPSGQRVNGRDMISAACGLDVAVKINNPNGPPPLLRVSTSTGKMLIKLLNRNYDYPMDTFAPINGADLVIKKSAGRSPVRFLLSSPETESVEIRGTDKDNEFHFHLPEIGIYASLEEIQ